MQGSSGTSSVVQIHIPKPDYLFFRTRVMGTRRAEGGGEELRLQSREGQELSAAAATCQLILKMSSEDQTVDPRNKLMEKDHGTIFVRFRAACRTGRRKLCK
jgi:hypothetical protein